MMAVGTSNNTQVRQAIELVRPHLDRKMNVCQRIRTFWVGVKSARKLTKGNVLASEFTALAEQTGLLADLGYHGRKDLEHVIQWGLRNQDPFGRRPHA